MAHLLKEKYKKKIKIFYINDSKSRIDRPPMLFHLTNFCEHGIEVNVENKLRIPLKILDKITLILPLLGSKLNRIFGICDEAKGWNIDSSEANEPRLVRGYFQSYSLVDRGFDSYKTEFLKLFKDMNDSIEISKLYEREFQIAHIRRGDYVVSADHWGLLSFSYYIKSLDISLMTYICSDDEVFCEQIQLRFPQAKILKPSEFTEWQILEIFSNSSYIVTANSTFSWWGGFLGKKMNNAKVVLPFPWFKAMPDLPGTLYFDSARIEKSIFE